MSSQDSDKNVSFRFPDGKLNMSLIADNPHLIGNLILDKVINAEDLMQLSKNKDFDINALLIKCLKESRAKESEKEGLEVVKTFIEAGALPDIYFPGTQNTALIIAVKNNDLDAVKLLIKKGANLFIGYNLIGESPLQLAQYYQFVPIVKFLQMSIETAKKTGHFTDEQKFLEKRNIIKEAGHILGLSTEIPIDGPRGTLQESTEEVHLVDSVGYLIESLKQYLLTAELNSDLKENYEDILNAMQFEKKYLEFNGSISPKEFIDRYHENFKGKTITSFPSSTIGHDVAFITFDKKYAIFCNRGVGKTFDFGTAVYHIPEENQDKINEKFLSLTHGAGGVLPYSSLVKLLGRVINVAEPLSMLPSKEQRHGTCSFVNLKSAIEGLLYVKKLENLKKKIGTKEGVELGIHNMDDAVEIAKAFARMEYKKFTNFIRNAEIKKLITLYKSASDPKDIKFFHDLFFKILSEHHGQEKPDEPYKRTEKMNQELGRAKELLLALDPKTRGEMIARLAAEDSKLPTPLLLLYIVSLSRQKKEVGKSALTDKSDEKDSKKPK